MLEIRCEHCTRTLGAVSAPSKSDLQRMAQKAPTMNPYAGMLRLIPDDITETIVAMCAFQCPTCLMERQHNGEQKDDGEEVNAEARTTEGRHTPGHFRDR